MHLARLAGLDDETDARARLRAHEVVVHGRGREQRGDRRELGRRVTVGEDDDVGAARDRVAHLAADRVDRVAQRVAAAEHRVQAGDRDRPVAELGCFPIDVAELGEVVVRDDRVRQHDLATRRSCRLEQVALRADRRRQRRHQRLEVGVERRVRDLREQLLEVLVEHARPVRQHRCGRVGAHRPERLDRVARHRGDDQAQVLLRVSEQALQLHRGGVDGRERVLRRQVVEMHEARVEPQLVRLLGRERRLDLLVGNEATLRGVDEEDLARLEPAFRDDALGRDVEHADLARHHDEVVVGDPVARRPQPVAVEHRADHGSVGERDRRGAVPRLHERRVVPVERAVRGRHRGVVLPRLRDHHQHRVVQRTPREMEQFERLVEAGGVARAGRADREDALEIGQRLVVHHAFRARIQFSLPCTVLISPLCAMTRYGCASGQLGKVFVEKRECTRQSADAARSSERSG